MYIYICISIISNWCRPTNINVLGHLVSIGCSLDAILTGEAPKTSTNRPTPRHEKAKIQYDDLI